MHSIPKLDGRRDKKLEPATAGPTTRGNMAAAAPPHVHPVFLLNRELPGTDEKDYSVFELCTAAEKTAGFETMEGAQRIGSLWRLYPKSIDARIALLTTGMYLRGHTVTPKDKNPFVVKDNSGQEREVQPTRVVVGNVPISVSNEDILMTIQQLGIKTRSRLLDERERDQNGKLTRWKTGRRFIYIDVPERPLPKTIKVGQFTASVYHKEQKSPACSRCLEKDHRASACTAPIKCRQCLCDGHRAGDKECQLAAPLPPPQAPTAEKGQPKQTTIREYSRNAEGELPALSRRSRSLTPAAIKRHRSPSQQRSPKSAGTKLVKTHEREKQQASVAAAPASAQRTTPPSDRESGMEDANAPP